MKRLKLILLVMLIVVLMLFIACGTTKEKPKTYNWNNGRCEVCGGELMWESTGSKEHYICKLCKKEYTFDGVKSKK